MSFHFQSFEVDITQAIFKNYQKIINKNAVRHNISYAKPRIECENKGVLLPSRSLLFDQYAVKSRKLPQRQSLQYFSFDNKE